MNYGLDIFPQSWNDWVDRQNIPLISENWHEERRKQAEIEAAIARAGGMTPGYQDPPRHAQLGPDARHKGAGTLSKDAKDELKDKKKDDPNLMQQAFLMSLAENLHGGDIGQAQAVVTGGARPFPTMMQQFSPYEQQKPYWWIA